MDHFGHAVSISGSTASGLYAVVGAPNAEDHGVLEVQRIYCRP